MSNSLNLTRALALNDAGGTQLFTFLLSMNDLERFFDRPTKSSPIYYEGHEWYLTCSGYQSKETDDIFLGIYLYWDNKAAGEGVSCRADYRLIVRNVTDASESVVSEGSQVEFSAPDTLGWGKRELAPLHEILGPGNGYLVDPGRTVIVELAIRYCRTIYQQVVDFSQLPEHMNQPYASYFTPNFSLCGFGFYLSFYPLGDREEAERHVSMYLHRFNNPQTPECLCCRIRYRFFLGDQVSPSGDSKTFEFSFRSDRGYGRFKAFEPLSNSDIFNKGLVPMGVEILSVTPFAFAELPLATRGYYHTDNFILEDAIFPDHRMNVWKLSASNSSQYLSFRLDVEDRNRIHPISRQGSGRESLCTKYLQWKAYLLSRTDRIHNVSISENPMSAYYSPSFPEKLFSMATNIPIQRAKALDGDYCTNEEPALLLRIEFFNVQDIPGVMQDYPVLEFERVRLYQTREGLRRCLDVNGVLRSQLNDLRQRMNELMNLSEGSASNSGKQQLIREFRSLLQASDETDSSSQTNLKVPTPGSEHFATAFSFPGSTTIDAPATGRISPYIVPGASKDPSNKVSQLFSSRSNPVLADFGSAPPTTTAMAMPSPPKSKMASLGAVLRTKGAPTFLRGVQARASTTSTSSVKFSSKAPPANSKHTPVLTGSQSILKEGHSKHSRGDLQGQRSSASLDRQQVVNKHFNTTAGNAPASQLKGVGASRSTPEQTIYASIAVSAPTYTVPTVSSPASNTFAVVSKPKYDSEPAQHYDSSSEQRKPKFNPNIFKSVFPKKNSSDSGDKSSTFPRSSQPAESSTDFFGNRTLERPKPGVFHQQPSRSTTSLGASHTPLPAVQKVVPTQSPSSTLTRSGGISSLNNPGNYSSTPPTTITTAIVMPVQDMTYTHPDRLRKPPVPAPRRGLMKNPSDGLKPNQDFDDDQTFEVAQFEEYVTKPSLDFVPTLEQKPEDKGAFSRASVASMDDPMLQTEVYSLFAKAAKEGVKLVEEAPEMDEPIAIATPEPKSHAQTGSSSKPSAKLSAKPPGLTATDSASAQYELPRHVNPHPPSPSILKKKGPAATDQVAMRKSRSANNVRFSEDNDVSNVSSSHAIPAQAQSVDSQGDRKQQFYSYDQYVGPSDQYSGEQYSGEHYSGGHYSRDGQSASYGHHNGQQTRQQQQQQQQQQHQYSAQEDLQYDQYRAQLQQQQRRQLQQMQQQHQQPHEQYNAPYEAQGLELSQPVTAEQKQVFRLQQLRREHQEYVNQLLQQQQQQQQQRQVIGEQYMQRNQSDPRSESNLSREKSASAGIIQTSL